MRLRTINEAINDDRETPGYISPYDMKDGTFEREMWTIGSLFGANNITVPEERDRLIKYIENDLYIINREKAGKMTKQTARSKRKIPRATEEYLRETLEKLKKYAKS